MRCALGLRQMSCDRLLLLLLLVGFEVAAQAAADAPVEPQASDDFFRESGAKVLKMFDKDLDGRLSPKEVMGIGSLSKAAGTGPWSGDSPGLGGTPEEYARVYASIDTDGDGELSHVELGVYFDHLMGSMPKPKYRAKAADEL